MLRIDPLFALSLTALLFVAGGASCPRPLARKPEQPAVFLGPPTMADVIDVINTADRVEKLQTQNATLTVHGVPLLRANLAYQRPRDLRLRAQLTSLTGQELDLGSNNELFWMWVRRSPQRAIYFARHDQYASSAARDILPVEPDWLIEALGIIHLDPYGVHEGPYPQGEDQLKIRSRVPSSTGELTRVLIMHSRYGWVKEQYLYDAGGRLLASARASRHRFYSEHGVALPHHVDIQLAPGTPSQLAFGIEVGGYSVNQLDGDPGQLFVLPEMDNYPLVNLADPNLRLQGPGGVSPPRSPQPTAYRQPPRAPVYRATVDPLHSPSQSYRGFGPK